MRNTLIVTREMKKWSPPQVASELGITSDEYQRLENGEGLMTIKIAQKLGELYDISPEYFLNNEAKVINYNTGTFSKGVIHAVTFHENKESESGIKDLIKIIESLKSELAKSKKK